MHNGVVALDKSAGRKACDSRFDAPLDHLFKLMIESETFRAAPVMRALLLYLWQHQGESLSEYAIGVEALGRPPDFDPKEDATVRVGISRLRAKIRTFYEGEIEPSPLQLTIPLGGHEIRWIQIPDATSRVSIFRAPPQPYRNMLLGSIIVGAVLAALCMILVLENRTLRASLPAPPPELPRLWRSFLASGKDPIVVVPSPLFFRWSANADILIRDATVGQFQDWASSSYIRRVAEKWGPPSLAQIYLPVPAVKSATRILRYLESHGQRPELTDSPNLASDSARTRNTIFLGSLRQYAAGDWVTQILGKTNFYIRGFNPSAMGNRNPGPGEASEYREVDFSAEHKLVLEMVTLLPPAPNGARSLLLLGPSPSVSSFLVLSPDGLKLLDAQWMKAGSPDSWEMLVQAETNGETVLRLQPIAIRRIPATFWE